MAAGSRSYTAGHFLLSLDNQPAVLKKVDGGNIKGEVVTIKGGPSMIDMKHISTVKFEDFKVEVGMSMGKPLYEWIRASLDYQHLRKNGYVVAADFNYKAQSYRHFRDALITEITIPALDGSSKDSAFFTVGFAVEETVYAKGDDAQIKGEVNTKQKKWLCSNFRLRLGDLDCTKISKIDSFTIKQAVVQDDLGEQRISMKEIASLEFPSLKITSAKSAERSWAEWFDDFVIRGNNGQEKELTGAIEFLDPSGKEVLGSVDLFNVGIFAMQNAAVEPGKTEIARFTVELYVEKMQLNLNYV